MQRLSFDFRGNSLLEENPGSRRTTPTQAQSPFQFGTSPLSKRNRQEGMY